jgi:O-antigen/teichoic acid export membrane protein
MSTCFTPPPGAGFYGARPPPLVLAERHRYARPDVETMPAESRGDLLGWLRRLAASDILRNILHTYSSRVLLLVLGLVATAVASRFLGPLGRGLHATASTVAMLAIQLGNLGLHSSNSYWVAKDPGRLPALVGNSLIIGGVLGAACGVLATLVYSLIPDPTPLPAVFLGLAALTVPLSLVYTLLTNLLIGVGQIRACNLVEVAVAVIGLCLTVGMIQGGHASIVRLFALGPLTSCLSVGLLLWLLRGQLGGRPPVVSLDVLREGLGFTLRAYLANLFMLCLLRVDLLQVEHLRGPEEAGLYSAAVSVCDKVLMLTQITGTVIYPKLVALPDDEARWELARRSLRAVAAVTGPVCLVAGVLAGPAIAVLFGRGFDDAAPALRCLLPGTLLLALNTFFMIFFAAVGMPSFTFIATGVAALANVALNLVFIPLWGAAGASTASTIVYGGLLLASFIYRRARLRRG